MYLIAAIKGFVSIVLLNTNLFGISCDITLCYIYLFSFIFPFHVVYFCILSFISVLSTDTKSPVISITERLRLIYFLSPNLILPFSSQNAEAIMSGSINPTF